MSESFSGQLIAGLEEAVAHERGELAARTRTEPLTAREAEVAATPRYGRARLRAVRQKLGASQHVFARALNVSDRTVKAWEQGERVPDGPTLRLIELAEEHPEVFEAKMRRTA